MMAGTIRGSAMPAPALVGPLFFWDVVRLARRGRGTALRALYGALLLAALAGVYAAQFGTGELLSLSRGSAWTSLEAQARFAHRFAGALMLAQNVAVLVLVPAYLAGAIAEEKEKKTLDLLFTTALTDREIVVGKLLGRLAHVTGVLLAGLPVLSLAQLWGGIDVTVLLANFAATGLTLLSVGGVCLVCSALANTTPAALVLSYGASALLGVGCLCPVGPFVFSPLAFPFAIDHGMGQAAPGSSVAAAVAVVCAYATVHATIGVFAVGFAAAVLRPSTPRRRPTEPPLLPEVVPPPRPVPVVPPEADGVYRPSPPVGDAPLLWKEVLHGTGHQPPAVWLELLTPLGIAVLIAVVMRVGILLESLSPAGPVTPHATVALLTILGGLLRSGVVILLTVACVVVGFRAAGSVVRERARGTLDGLLALPVPRVAILRAKWLGSVLRVRVLFYMIAAAWLFCLCTGALHPLVFPLAVLTAAAHVVFIAALGLYVSLCARSIHRAHFIMALLLLLYFGYGWAVWYVTGARWGHRYGGTELLTGLTPWRAWWESTFPLVGAGSHAWKPREVAMLGLVALCYLLAAAALWYAAVLRFRNECGPAVARPGKVP